MNTGLSLSKLGVEKIGRNATDIQPNVNTTAIPARIILGWYVDSRSFRNLREELTDILQVESCRLIHRLVSEVTPGSAVQANITFVEANQFGSTSARLKSTKLSLKRRLKSWSLSLQKRAHVLFTH